MRARLPHPWLLIAMVVVSLPAAALDWSKPWVFTHDPTAALQSSDEYAWRAFVAVNWPADMRTRSADATRDLSANTATVWETWQNTKDIFLLGGGDPGAWQSSIGTDPATGRFDTGSFLATVPARRIVNGVMVEYDPVADARHLNETRMNRAAFEYIRANNLYNLDGQLAQFRRGIAPRFPAESVEVKAQWRPITEQQRDRYHTLTVSTGNGSRLYGLTALHIASKDAANWFWATFEHVDNETSAQSAESWILRSEDRFGCRGLAPDCNRAPQAIGLEGTVWQNYRLRGTMTRPVDDHGQPLLLANSHLEAGVQRSASCITCHARASFGMVEGKATHLSIVRSDVEPLARDSSHGYVGAPDDAWFFSAGPLAKERLYLPLDFVWSLTKAQPRSSP